MVAVRGSSWPHTVPTSRSKTSSTPTSPTTISLIEPAHHAKSVDRTRLKLPLTLPHTELDPSAVISTSLIIAQDAIGFARPLSAEQVDTSILVSDFQARGPSISFDLDVFQTSLPKPVIAEPISLSDLSLDGPHHSFDTSVHELLQSKPDCPIGGVEAGPMASKCPSNIGTDAIRNKKLPRIKITPPTSPTCCELDMRPGPSHDKSHSLSDDLVILEHRPSEVDVKTESKRCKAHSLSDDFVSVEKRHSEADAKFKSRRYKPHSLFGDFVSLEDRPSEAGIRIESRYCKTHSLSDNFAGSEDTSCEGNNVRTESRHYDNNALSTDEVAAVASKPYESNGRAGSKRYSTHSLSDDSFGVENRPMVTCPESPESSRESIGADIRDVLRGKNCCSLDSAIAGTEVMDFARSSIVPVSGSAPGSGQPNFTKGAPFQIHRSVPLAVEGDLLVISSTPELSKPENIPSTKYAKKPKIAILPGVPKTSVSSNAFKGKAISKVPVPAKELPTDVTGSRPPPDMSNYQARKSVRGSRKGRRIIQKARSRLMRKPVLVCVLGRQLAGPTKTALKLISQGMPIAPIDRTGVGGAIDPVAHLSVPA